MTSKTSPMPTCEAAQVLREAAQPGPAGIPTFGFGEAAAAFLQGEAAMHLDTLKIAAMSRDPKLSKIDGKVGYALHPVGSRCGSETGGFAAGIPANSQNKEAAFLFLQYITSKAGDQRMVELGGDPVRISTLMNNTEGFDEYPVVAEPLPCADPDWRPLIPEWNELNIEVLGQALNDALCVHLPGPSGDAWRVALPGLHGDVSVVLRLADRPRPRRCALRRADKLLSDADRPPSLGGFVGHHAVWLLDDHH